MLSNPDANAPSLLDQLSQKICQRNALHRQLELLDSEITHLMNMLVMAQVNPISAISSSTTASTAASTVLNITTPVHVQTELNENARMSEMLDHWLAQPATDLFDTSMEELGLSLTDIIDSASSVTSAASTSVPPELHRRPSNDFSDVYSSNTQLGASIQHASNTSGKRGPYRKRGIPGQKRVCTMCGTENTPAWRCTRTKKLVCNSCGLWLKKNRTDLGETLAPTGAVSVES